MQNMALFFLVAVAIGGVAWVFLYPILSGEKKAEKRQETVVRTGSTVPARTARNFAEAAPRAGRRIAQAGRGPPRQVGAALDQHHPGRASPGRSSASSSPRGVLGVVAFILGLMLDAGLLPALGFGFAAGFGAAAVAAQIPQEAARGEIPGSLSRCGRHHRARHQGRPAAARQPALITSDAPEPVQERIPHHRRDPDRSASRSARPAASSTSASRSRRRTSSPS